MENGIPEVEGILVMGKPTNKQKRQQKRSLMLGQARDKKLQTKFANETEEQTKQRIARNKRKTKTLLITESKVPSRSSRREAIRLERKIEVMRRPKKMERLQRWKIDRDLREGTGPDLSKRIRSKLGRIESAFMVHKTAQQNNLKELQLRLSPPKVEVARAERNALKKQTKLEQAKQQEHTRQKVQKEVRKNSKRVESNRKAERLQSRQQNLAG